MLLHCSTVPMPGATEHCSADPDMLHTRLPVRWQAPTPTVHRLPFVGNVSSMFESQSSSLPLHSSADGEPAIAEHCVPVPDASQRITPKRWQTPTPTLHTEFTVGHSSSIMLSQSSST